MRTSRWLLGVALSLVPAAASAQVVYEAPSPDVQVAPPAPAQPPAVAAQPPAAVPPAAQPPAAVPPAPSPQIYAPPAYPPARAYPAYPPARAYPAYPPAPRVYAPPPAPPRYVYPPAPRVYVTPPRVYVTPPRVYAPYAPPAPHVYIRQRVRWHLRRAAAAILGAIPPPVVEVTPALPPPEYGSQLPPVPPPLVAPLPPCCVQPQAQAYAPPPPACPLPPPPEAPVAVEPAPVQVSPVVVRAPKPAPGWTSRVGLGVRATGQVVSSDWNNLGIGGELLYRMSNHWSMELGSEYQKNAGGDRADGVSRWDVPAMLGFRLHLGRPDWIVSPYFVAALGFDYANQDLRVTHDEAYYFDGQLGGGLEIRIGQHFALTFDARFDGKKRVDDPAEKVLATRSIDGKAVHALGDEYGGQFRLGAAVYF